MASIPTQDEVLAATRKGQEAMMAAIKTWLETVRTAAPKLPPRLPQVSLPFADKLPTPPPDALRVTIEHASDTERRMTVSHWPSAVGSHSDR